MYKGPMAITPGYRKNQNIRAVRDKICAVLHHLMVYTCNPNHGLQFSSNNYNWLGTAHKVHCLKKGKSTSFLPETPLPP